jgi:hypothetical protein
MEKKSVIIAISTAFQDAGDATRALEIAKGLKRYQPEDVDARIVFLSHGSKFEQKVLDWDLKFIALNQIAWGWAVSRPWYGCRKFYWHKRTCQRNDSGRSKGL